MERIPILCMADSDYFYFGVAPDGAEAAAMFRDSKLYNAEAWLTVSLEALELPGPGENHETYSTMKLVIWGEPAGDWTRADIDPVTL